jgi:hypothetical protein
VAIPSALIYYTTHSLTSIELKGKTEDKALSEYLYPPTQKTTPACRNAGHFGVQAWDLPVGLHKDGRGIMGIFKGIRTGNHK